MTKLSKDEIAAIVKKNGYRLVPEQRTDAPRSSPEAATPELSRLKSKYGRGMESGMASRQFETPILSSDTTDDDDETIVLVEPETKRDAFTRANRPKAKVISAKKKGFTGSQG